MVHFDVPGFTYNGVVYDRLSVSSNGYLIAGGGTEADNVCCDLTRIPDVARPNNVIAPLWTDLDGTGAQGIFVTQLTDGVNVWTVVEWRVNVFGTNDRRMFQVWLGINGVQDIQYAYSFDTMAPPHGNPFLIGAENADGTAGVQLPAGTVPTTDLRVTSSAPQPGGKASYTVTVQGIVPGSGQVRTAADTPVVAGTTTVHTVVAVK